MRVSSERATPLPRGGRAASTGVRYLVVGGTIVVDEGKIVPNVYPGRALLGPGRVNSGNGF